MTYAASAPAASASAGSTAGASFVEWGAVFAGAVLAAAGRLASLDPPAVRTRRGAGRHGKRAAIRSASVLTCCDDTDVAPPTSNQKASPCSA